LPYSIGIDTRKIRDFGIGTYIRNLVRSLAELDRENRYVLIAGRDGREVLGDLPDNFEVTVEASSVYSLRELAALSWKLYRLRLDLYHSTHYVLPAVLPCRVVATIHDIIHLLYPDYLPSRLAFLYAQRMIRRTLSHAHRIVTVSHNTKADLMDYFGVDGRKIEVVYNGVEESFRRRLPQEEIADRLARLGLKRPYLLFVGNPKPHKNLDNVVRAFALARQLKPFAAPLVCVGARESAELRIRQRAAQLGIADAVILLGHVEQEALPALYQGADLFVYPTLYEGFGLPVVEAMASGVAVITSNTSALKEIAEGYAYLVDPLDLKGLAEAIAHCTADPERRASLAKLGSKRALEFDWRRAAAATLAVYYRALSAPPPAFLESPGER
jgi:glycosyltransferase involved in cell wall biosynthesis